MYVKRLQRNGREIIVTLFVVGGRVTTAFAPTFETIPGPVGHTEEFVEYYIKKQEMVKRFEDAANKVVDDVSVGERAKRKRKPSPPT